MEKISILLIFTTCVIYASKGQDTSSFEQKQMEISKLKDLISESYSIKPESNLHFINKGLDIANQLDSPEEIAWFKSYKGLLFFYQGYHDEATNLLFETAELYRRMNDQKNLGNTYANLAMIEKDVSKKLGYFRKALEIFQEEEGADLGIARVYLNMGSHYLNHDELDLAIGYFKKALIIGKEINDSLVSASALFNITSVNKIREEIPKDSILNNFKAALKIYESAKYGWGIVQAQLSIAQYFYKNDEPDSSLKHLHRTISLSENRFSEIIQKAYTLLIKIKSENGNFEEALQYQQILDSINNFIAANDNRNLTSLIETEYKYKLEKERIAKLNTEMAKSRNTKIFALSSLGLVLIFSVIVFKLQRDRIHKKNKLIEQNKLHADIKLKLADSELMRAKLEKDHLNERLDFTSKELAQFASSVVQNNELLKDIQHKIESMKTSGTEAGLKKQLHELSVMLMQMNNSDEKQKNLYKKAENLNQNLLFEIRKQFPQLTESDTHLLVLIILKFNSKEIGAIYNIELNSVHIKRHRLRKKLDMETEDTFEDFFDRHFPDLNLYASLSSD